MKILTPAASKKKSHHCFRRNVPEDDNWERFYSNIGSCSVYSDDQMIDNLLHDLNTSPIKHVHIMDGGTQVKFVFTFKNDKQAVFKPMRFDEQRTPENSCFLSFSDLDAIMNRIRIISTSVILNDIMQKSQLSI